LIFCAKKTARLTIRKISKFEIQKKKLDFAQTFKDESGDNFKTFYRDRSRF
jgi:hypothetical protein